MASLQKNVASQNFTFCLVFATSGAAAPGLTVSGFVTKDGGAQGATAGTFTSLGNGQYNYAPTQAETNATDVGFLATATGAIPVNIDFHTDLTGAGGRLLISENLQQNTALNGYTFLMVNAATGSPQTGLTVTAQRSLAGAALTLCTNSPTEVGNGIYTINLSAADLNAATLMLRFSATGAADTDINIITTP